MPKEDELLGAPGRLLNFYKSFHRPLLEHTKDKRPNLMPSDQWWIITYAVVPEIDAINVTLAQLQARSLLIGQQKTLMHNLLGTIIATFEIEIGDTNGGEAHEDDAYMQQGMLRILAMAIVNHIENQGSFARECYERLETADQQDVINHIATYVMALIAQL